jgi:hypothetical protein
LKPEGHLDRAQLADPAVHTSSPGQPLRVLAHHEGLLDELAGAVAHGDEGTRLFRAQRDRLLAEHVFARLRGLDRPGHVEVIRERVVDGVHVGVGQEILVRA